METAEDFLNKKNKEINNEGPSRDKVIEWLIEFAKMHIKEAISEINKNHKMYAYEDNCGIIMHNLDPYSVEKAYPLTNVV